MNRTRRGRQRASGRVTACALSAVCLVMAACGSDSDAAAQVTAGAPAATVVVTTSIWADVVSNVACTTDINVELLIPAGSDPHGFEPSLADRGRMESAALVVANGLALEERLQDTLDAVVAEGTPLFNMADHVETIEFSTGAHEDHDDHDDEDHDDHGDEDHEDHADEDHGDHGDEKHEDHDDHADEDHEDHADEDHDDHADEDHDEHDDEDHGDHADEKHEDHDDHAGHGHDGGDPHIWFDPIKTAAALPELADALVEHAGVDADVVAGCVEAYQAELTAVDAEIAALVSGVADDRRKLITNHDSLGYFADRYGFEVIGTVIPSPNGLAEANPFQLEELSKTIAHESVPAIFAEAQHSDSDARALAERVGDVDVVKLLSGALSPSGSEGDTYLGFLRHNATLISDALS